MSKPTLKQLSKLLRSFRKDGLVNIVRKDNITAIQAMHEDYASMIACAQRSTEGPDYDEIVLGNIEIEADGIGGDKKDQTLLKKPYLPEFRDHIINVKLIGETFANPVKKHATAVRYKDHRTYRWCNNTRFDFKQTRVVIATRDADLSARTVIVSCQYIPETGRLLNQHFDTAMLNERIFRHLTPEDLTIKIQEDTYPLELEFWIGPVQCYYIQSPRIVRE